VIREVQNKIIKIRIHKTAIFLLPNFKIGLCYHAIIHSFCYFKCIFLVLDPNSRMTRTVDQNKDPDPDKKKKFELFLDFLQDCGSEQGPGPGQAEEV
jgi:hypothetical protein